jgi:hypothetical protein
MIAAWLWALAGSIDTLVRSANEEKRRIAKNAPFIFSLVPFKE